MRINPEAAVVILLGIGIGFVPAAPRMFPDHPYRTVLGLSAIAVACVLAIIGARKHYYADHLLVAYLLFQLLIVPSVIKGLFTYSFTNVLIAFAPFIPLLAVPIFVPVFELLMRQKLTPLMFAPFIVSTIVLSVRYAITMIGHLGGENVFVRLTLLEFDAVLFANAFGLFSLLAIYSGRHLILRTFLICSQIFFALMTYTRGLLLSLIISCFVVLFLTRKPRIHTLVVPLLALILTVFVSAKWLEISVGPLYTENVRSRLISTFSEEDQGTRFNEVRTSISWFKASPVIGMGFGFHAEVLTEEGVVRDTQYIHNGGGYFLMNSGLFGLIWYYLPILFGIFYFFAKTQRNSSRSIDYFFAFLCGSYLHIFVFSQIFAVFRNPSFNLILALVISASIAAVRVFSVRNEVLLRDSEELVSPSTDLLVE
jgi:hypothetical protein